MSMAGSVVSSSAPSAPSSITTLKTPAGSPAASAAVPKTSDESGSEGTRSKDHGVAGHQRRDQLLKRHDDGAVVRGDGTHHADRLVATDAQCDLAAYEVVERDRIRFLVREGLVEVDRLSTERQSHGDLRALSHHARLALPHP